MQRQTLRIFPIKPATKLTKKRASKFWLVSRQWRGLWIEIKLNLGLRATAAVPKPCNVMPMFHPMSFHVIQCFILGSDLMHRPTQRDGASESETPHPRSLRRITGGLSYVTACLVALTRIGAIHISPPLSQSVPPLMSASILSVSSPRGPGTTSYVTTCQNWRSSNSQRRSPVQSTSLDNIPRQFTKKQMST